MQGGGGKGVSQKGGSLKQTNPELAARKAKREEEEESISSRGKDTSGGQRL